MKRRTFISSASLLLPSFKLNADPSKPPRFIFTICASGGASIIDSFLPIRRTEAATGIHSFNDAGLLTSNGFKVVAPIPGIKIESVKLGNGYSLKTFADKHGADLLVVPHSVTSVNHLVAAARSLTGNNINSGKTLAEAVAEVYGKDLLLANINMAQGGYAEHGTSLKLPSWSKAEAVLNPLNFAYSLSYVKGIEQVPGNRLLSLMRSQRSRFEASSPQSKDAQDYALKRDAAIPTFANGELFDAMQLQILPEASRTPPLSVDDSQKMQYQKLQLERLRVAFPSLEDDGFEAQAALAFLLAKNGVSRAITIDPGSSPIFSKSLGLEVPPLAFDWSHRDHIGAQNAMWSKICSVTDQLISLLKSEPALGEVDKTLWDQSLIYIATEFGRDKKIVTGSGHHVNNGSVIISPLIKGGRVAGGVDPSTGLTYGANLSSGEILPNLQLFEQDVYSLILEALGVSFSGQKSAKAFVKS